ncbi:MAG: fibronectin type III domain-containing protein [Bacteroidia bacterium]|nr:fibronectin type III domain-containing protein [Bacteroidia bacterium]
MKKFVVSLKLSKKSISQKIEFGNGVDTAMIAAPVFAAVSNPTIAEMKAATLALEIAANNAAAAGGGTLLTSIMHDKEDEFDLAITGMGRNVDNIAKGDKSIILLAGMEADKERTPAQVPDAPSALSAVAGLMPGSVGLKWKRPPFGLYFNVYMSVDPPTADSWKLAGQTTKTKFTVTGLDSLKKYWFRVEAIGTKGTGPASDPAISAAL